MSSVVAIVGVALLGLVASRKGGPMPFDRLRGMAAGRLFPTPLAVEVPASEPPRPLKMDVYVVEPFGAVAVDGAGGTEIGAEPERKNTRSPSGPALTETDRRERAYRLYLKRHGWRPLREVLEEMDR